MRKRAWASGVLVLPATLLGVAAPAQAVDFSSTVGASAEHSDNAVKSGGSQRSEVESRTWLRVGLEHEGPRLQTGLGYRFERVFFRQDTQDDRTTIEGDARLMWEAIAGRGFLEVTHSRRNVLQDRALVDIQDNREDRDITRVTPSYRFQLTPVDTLTASAFWSGVNYQRRGDLDSERYGGQLTWAHRFSEVDTLLVDLSTSRVDFRSSAANNYDYHSATVGYSALLRQISYTVRGGVNRADRSGGDRDVTGGLLELTAGFQSGSHSWQLDLGHRLTDSSLGNNNRGLPDFGNFDGTFDRVDVITRTNAQLSWTWVGVCERCTLRLAAVYDREDYEEEPSDNTEIGVNTGFSYRLTRVSDLSLGYKYRDLSFQGDNTRDDYDIHEVSLRYDHRFGDRLRVGLFVADERRRSQGGGVDYDELRGGLSISYDLL